MTDMIKRGDLKPDWQVTLDDGGAPVNLTLATEIRVFGWKDGALLVNRVVTGTEAGVITMPWQTADTATVGDILFEVQVTWPGAKPQTFPADGYLRTRVYRDLG